jgi:hypothetical protein
MESLDLNAAPHLKRPSREMGLPWSLLMIPVLLFAGAVSVPVSLVSVRIQRRRDLAFRKQMLERGRIIEWARFLQAIAEDKGTLLEERYSLKGPVRWWWTSENVYEICPHPMVDWMTTLNDPSFRPTIEWFRQWYTDPSEGRAFLVVTDSAAQEELRAFRSQLECESGSVRWIEVVPPESLRKHS